MTLDRNVSVPGLRTALLLLPLALSGCLFPSFVEPRYSLEDRVVVILPLRDLTADRNRRWYGESERGIAVTRRFREWAETQSAGLFPAPDVEARLVAAVRSWLKDEFSRDDWKKLLAATRVDAVVLGEIVEFRHKQPQDINLYRGSAAMNYEVIDATGRTLYRTPSPREVAFPKQGEVELPEFNVNIAKNIRRIEAGLVRELGILLGKELYGYYED